MRRLAERGVLLPVVIGAVGLTLFTVAIGVIAIWGPSDSSHHHHPITVLERKVDRIKAKQSAQIAADRHTLHQLTRAMELLP